MSLFRKIRRRHKAFVSKRSAQIHGDKAASIFPVNDGEDRGEDGDTDSKMDYLQQQMDEQNGDISVSAGYERQQVPFSMEHIPVQTDDSAQSCTFASADSGIDMGQDMKIVGKESRFWFRIAKTAVFWLVTVGAFSIGKVAAMGITLTVALTFKWFAKDQVNSPESFVSAETEQSPQNHESLPSNTEMVRLGSKEMAMEDSGVPLMDGRNGMTRLFGSHLVMNASGHRHKTLQAHNEEALDFKASGDTLLAQRKKLKRLNCIKIPPSASTFVESKGDSPSSSGKASPRTWFRPSGNLTPTGNDTDASAVEMNKQEKFKSKVLLRHLRRKGEPWSSPSSPLSSSPDGSNNFSDGSDTDRSVPITASVNRRSKFRPASPAKEALVTNASVGLPDQQTVQTLASRKGERTSLPATSMGSEALVTDVHNPATQKHEMDTSAFIPAGRETLAMGIHIPPSQAVTKMEAAAMPATPTSRDATPKVGINSPLASTHELLHHRREKDLSSMRPRVEMRRKQVRVGTPWVTAGLMIMLAGLFGGRMMAVTGLVCYWYVLSSFKNRKASKMRR